MIIDFFLSAGYPLISHFMARKPSNSGGFNLGGINASGQVGLATFHFLLISITPRLDSQHDRELGIDRP